MVIMIKLCIPVIFLSPGETEHKAAFQSINFRKMTSLLWALGFQSQEMLDWVRLCMLGLLLLCLTLWVTLWTMSCGSFSVH